MNRDKYILELNIEQAVILYMTVKSHNWDLSSYEPLKELAGKIDTICKDIKT